MCWHSTRSAHLLCPYQDCCHTTTCTLSQAVQPLVLSFYRELTFTCTKYHLRLYNHLLLVLPDSEFYQEGPHNNSSTSSNSSLSLGQARAVVTSLNSLVFHTHLPRTPTGVSPGVHTHPHPHPHPHPHSQPHPHSPNAPQHIRNQQELHSNSAECVGVVKAAVAACGGQATALLADSAPLLLRSLYERDTRCVVCVLLL